MLITNTGFHGQSENYGDDLKAFLPNFNEILPPRDARDLVAFIRQNKIEVVVSSTPGEKSTGPQDYLTADFLREKLLALDFQEIDKDFFGKKIFAKGIPLYHLTQ